MRARRIFVLAACFLISAAVCYAEGSKSAKETGSIAGRVLDGDGRMVAGAQIELFKFDEQLDGYGSPMNTAKSDDDGRFSFADLTHGRFVIVVRAEGSKRALLNTSLQHDQNQCFDIVVRPLVAATIQLRDETGKPISGAQVRELKVRNENGGLKLSDIDAESWKALDLVCEPSDAVGQIHLPQLPDGSIVDVTLKHVDFAPTEITNVAVKSGVAADSVMHSGVRLKFRIVPSADGKTVSTVNLRLENSDSDSPSRFYEYPLSVQADGTASITIGPGKYRLIELTHDNFFITPTYRKREVFDTYEIAASKNDEFSFMLRNMEHASGKVTDEETGEPLKEAGVSVQIPNHPATDWQTAAYAKTDANGEYHIEVPDGAVLLSTYFANYTMGKAFLKSEVKPDATDLPAIKLRRNPTIRGQVVDPEGKPAAGAVIRLRGIFNYLRHAPAMTDSNGKFELPVARIPENFDEPNDPELAWTQPLDAFAPMKPLSARVIVDLDQPKSFSNVTIQLQHEDCDGFLQRAKAPTTDWAQKAEAHRAKFEEAHAKLIGQPAPELDGALWINVDKPSMNLADFHGKYVLLDFWAVWCGPCHADFPEIKLLHDLYKDHGLVVIGVHDNSVDADSVREHVKQQRLEFPIVVDQRDGKILAKYEAIGLVDGFPSYVLIGPDGNIAAMGTDGFQMEYARKYLFGGEKP